MMVYSPILCNCLPYCYTILVLKFIKINQSTLFPAFPWNERLWLHDFLNPLSGVYNENLSLKSQEIDQS